MLSGRGGASGARGMLIFLMFIIGLSGGWITSDVHSLSSLSSHVRVGSRLSPSASRLSLPSFSSEGHIDRALVNRRVPEGLPEGLPGGGGWGRGATAQKLGLSTIQLRGGGPEALSETTPRASKRGVSEITKNVEGGRGCHALAHSALRGGEGDEKQMEIKEQSLSEQMVELWGAAARIRRSGGREEGGEGAKAEANRAQNASSS
eukprot:3473993-Rhodomonas_salina.2